MTAATAGATDGGLPVQVILGPCDDMRAEVFVRVPRPAAAGQSLRIAGELTGPECRRSITLPAAAVLNDLGPGEASLLAKAVLTEPAFWTPELPNLYRLTVRLVADGEAVAEAARRVGLRRSGARGRSLWLEGRRWVPRGVTREPQSCDLAVMHDAGVAAVVVDPPEPLLAQADESGTAVIAVAEAATGRPLDADAVGDRIAAWAGHPSVVIAALPQSFIEGQVAAAAAVARRIKGTMLLAGMVAGASPPPVSVPAGIDCVLVLLEGGGLPHAAWREAAPPLPLIAWERGGAGGLAGRPDCDRLQAALAAWGLADGRTAQPWDWAGYVVS